MGLLYAHLECINEECGSSDAMSVYEKETDEGELYYDAHCFSCSTRFKQHELRDSYVAGLIEIPEKTSRSNIRKKGGALRKQEPKASITRDEALQIQQNAGEKGFNFRGISDEALAICKIRTEFDGKGQITRRYYPTTEEGKLAGYKVRTVEGKKFHSVGNVGQTNDLFNQQYYLKDPSKMNRTCIIVGGEEDVAATIDMFIQNQRATGKDYTLPVVVSPTTGETSSKKQIQLHYEWFQKFDKIIVGMDMDKTGIEATAMICEVLPPDRVFVAHWPEKDPNECLEKGRSKEFIAAYFRAEKHVPAGIVSSSSLSEAIREAIMMAKLPLPPFMHQLMDMTAGGISIPSIVNIAAKTGIGKTTIINEILYYWFFNSPYKVGVVSLELSSGEYGIAMLSRHVGQKINLFETPELALEFLSRPEVVEKERELLEDENGNPRWYLLDEREGSIEALKRKVEQLIISCGCRVIVLDPLQDILDGMTNEEQSLFMKWQKQMIKSHQIIFVNISHVRKSNGEKLSEEDLAGSSTIIKSGHINILVDRDKQAEDLLERNTIKVYMPKCRSTGRTGPAGEWIYDSVTHTLHDKEMYIHANPHLLAQGVDAPKEGAEQTF